MTKSRIELPGGDIHPIQRLGARISTNELALEQLGQAVQNIGSVLNLQVEVMKKLISQNGFNFETFVKEVMDELRAGQSPKPASDAPSPPEAPAPVVSPVDPTS